MVKRPGSLETLRRRLARLQGPAPGDPALQRRLRRYARVRRPDPRLLARRLGGRLLDEGRLVAFERRFPAPSRYLEHAPLLTLGQVPEPLDLHQVVFLDLEATGTSFGLGNLPFLVAIGAFQQGEWTVRQYLLTDPAYEVHLHHRLVALLQTYEVVATYNGKSFDLRLLEHRWRYLGIPVLGFQVHLDVYHLVRRLLPPGRPAHLRAAEVDIAGLRREHDIPSQEVPAAYFAYLHRGVLENLRRAVLHNRWDVFSLPWILHGLDRRVMQGLEAPDPWTLFALGRLHERLGAVGQAMRFYRRAAARSLGDLRIRALVRLARGHQRIRQYSEAARLWQQILAEDPGHPEALLQLAKYYEHRERDLPRALRLALRLPDTHERRHRVRRLLKKLRTLEEATRLQTPTLLREKGLDLAPGGGG